MSHGSPYMGPFIKIHYKFTQGKPNLNICLKNFLNVTRKCFILIIYKIFTNYHLMNGIMIISIGIINGVIYTIVMYNKYIYIHTQYCYGLSFNSFPK